MRIFLVMLSLVAFAALSLPAPAFAAPFEFTAAAKTSFDKMVNTANTHTAALLKKQYTELQTLQQQDVGWDSKISSLHYINEENETALRKRIKDIDVGKIKALEETATKTKAKYKPLFDLYEVQKGKLSLAKAAKNKDLTAFVNTQVGITKAAVQSAKRDISSKAAAVKKAKSDASAKRKELRAMLSANDAAKTRIKAAKSAASSSKKLFTSETKKLLQAVRKSDSSAATTSFTRMLLYQRQIITQKSNMYSYEEQIASVIAKTEAKLKGYN